jgi:hypothetical protein
MASRLQMTSSCARIEAARRSCENPGTPLTAGESANVDSVCGINVHALGRRSMSDRRDDKLAIVVEADGSASDEVIDAGRQE